VIPRRTISATLTLTRLRPTGYGGQAPALSHPMEGRGIRAEES